MTEISILMSVIGSIGVLGSIVIFSYGWNRNSKFERKLGRQSKAAVLDAAEEFTEIYTK